MPQSLSVVCCHLVFSTKDRRPWLSDPSLSSDLHAYMGGISNKLDCKPIRVGGQPDHIHLVGFLGRSVSQKDWVKELKRTSHLWLEKQTPDLCDFAWQGGYAIFSVSESNREQIESYVVRQEEHHRKRNYQDEVRGLLRKHRMEWDERYIWD
jgi:putative transposase